MRPVKILWLAAGVLTLGLGYCVLAAGPPPEEKDSRLKAQYAIVGLSNHLGDKDVPQWAKKIVEENDSCDISTIFALKRHRGLGIGKATEMGINDSVNALIPALANRKTTTEADLEKHKDDLLRVAKAMQAMAELAPYRLPPHLQKNEQRVKEWADVSADFKVKSAAFRKAVEETDPKQVRLTATGLHNACNNCHKVRDGF